MAECRKKEQKKCRVCGDHALGSNFNAITCESCKAFFRRNALKTKEFKCPFNDNCKVDVVTRRFCQKCRLKKCFDIGMKKEWIMTEEEKQAKRDKIEKNRKRKSRPSSKQGSEVIQTQEVNYVKVESPDPSLNQMLLSPVSSMSPLTPQTPGSLNNVIELPKKSILAHQPLTPSDCEYSPPAKVFISSDTVDEIYHESVISSECEISQHSSAYTEDNSCSSYKKDSLLTPTNLKSSSHCSKSASPEYEVNWSCGVSVKSEEKEVNCSCSEYKVKRENYLEIASTSAGISGDCLNDGIPDSVYEKAVSVEFTPITIRSDKAPQKQLNALENAKLQELVIANEVLKMPLIFGVSDPSLLDVINMTDHAIRRLIKMSKKINSFKSLCQNDQIALLKGGCTELMILRSVMSYDPEKNCWNGPQGPKNMSIKVDVLKEAKGNVYEEHKRFINSFLPDWRTNENIMLILSGIALFTPERPNTVHKEIIKLEQNTYYYLLRRYLETIYDWCEARTTYLKLIHKVQELHILNENHVRVYLDVNPKDVEPLLIEIFDLKH